MVLTFKQHNELVIALISSFLLTSLSAGNKVKEQSPNLTAGNFYFTGVGSYFAL